MPRRGSRFQAPVHHPVPVEWRLIEKELCIPVVLGAEPGWVVESGLLRYQFEWAIDRGRGPNRSPPRAPIEARSADELLPTESVIRAAIGTVGNGPIAMQGVTRAEAYCQ
ncbi:Hypothetical protein NTJ_10721 [Nesidiocoris tenuis]|uniref:Uncharacterized protein n=1 Tax=Nesidiocoris tenuis TaxID=355587 RepID=A0ABN7B3Z6_9HEMI|nr:Hypothetical protein NTJ_10721 [Nesidiocoris tenuis]